MVQSVTGPWAAVGSDEVRQLNHFEWASIGTMAVGLPVLGVGLLLNEPRVVRFAGLAVLSPFVVLPASALLGKVIA